MVEESKNKKWIVLERVGIFVGTLLLLFFICKFALFFAPFLIAGIIAMIIEPVIKFFMNKLKMSRWLSSAIVITLTILILGGLLIWGGSELVGELIKLSGNIAPAITAATEFVDNFSDIVAERFVDVPPQVINTLETSVVDFIGKLGTVVGNAATGVLKMLLSLPNIFINVIITILALVFFTKDRIYVIDMLEHHMPKTWIKRVKVVTSEIGDSVGGYIKVYLKIMVITFAEVFLAFNIYNWIGFNVQYPFALALVTAIIDILPILGVGTVLIPWAIWNLCIGNWQFAIALAVTYIIILVIRQILEPKLVSNQFGIHPIVTLMAMYAGYRTLGALGLILGPIILMALKCIFAKQLDRGLFKDLFDEK